MGIWSELGKIALDSLESYAISQDSAMQSKMEGHMKELYYINSRETGGGVLNVVGNAVVVGRQNQEYLSRLPRKEVLALSMFMSQQESKAKAVAEADRYDDQAADFARQISSICRVVEIYLGNTPS